MITYLAWWYGQEPVVLWRATEVISKKVFLTFSVPVLVRTLFDPWKRDITGAQNPSLQELFQIFVSNMISRMVGFFIRLFTIFTGFLVTGLCFILIFSILILWLFLPLIIIGLLIHGANLILNG